MNQSKLYNESGFKKENDAKEFIKSLQGKKAIVTRTKKIKTKRKCTIII